ncbi:MAG: response regulator [Bacteroidales bacterium]|nr:response regulator [Bacteroidales bacterium]
MEKIYILCVDDQAEVLDSVVRDLRPLSKYFRIEECGSAADAENVLSEILDGGDYVGLVISDHVMPSRNGVELLGGISKNPMLAGTRKILLTGQATHSDTIRAINEAHIDSYIEKPWKPEVLLGKVKSLLTAFIFEKGIPHEEFMPVLDQAIVLERLRRG